jgi:hypothetical protein
MEASMRLYHVFLAIGLFGVNYCCFRAGEIYRADMIQQGIESGIRAAGAPPDYSWIEKQPLPLPRTESQAYWQQWCRMKYGTAKAGYNFRQDALDWAQHCTEAGDANGR